MAVKKKTKRKAIKRKAIKRKAARRRAKSVPRAIITGTVEALSDFAARLAEIPGLVIKRVGF
jgi:hypothetical protein